MESLRGQLLIAAPTLLDPNFRRTVVLVCEHSEDGALGLVLNRPGDLEAAEAAPELSGLVGADETLWAGGPVQPSSIVVLAEVEEAGEALMVLERVGLVLQGADLDDLSARASRARAFVGYAGWGPDQLDGELEREDWIVVDAEPDDAFVEPEEAGALWGRALERKGGRYALLATMPVDPSVN